MARALPVVGRTLLRLGRSKATGVLSLRRGCRTLGLGFADGVVVAFEERRKPSVTPAARRQTETGEAAHSWSLRRMLVHECAWLAAGNLDDASFQRGAILRSPVLLPEPVQAVELVVRMGRKVPLGHHASVVLRTEWSISQIGEALYEAALGPHEAALLGALRQFGRAAGYQLVDLAGGHEALRVLSAWSELGLVSAHQDDRHGRLLTQKLAIRSGRLPHQMARLSRRDRRRAAAAVHPDRYEPALSRVSREVLEAMLAAGRSPDA